MSEHDCLNNEDQLDSVLDEVAQIDSEFDSVDDIDSDLEKVFEVIKDPTIDSISVNGINIEPDEDKNVNIEIPTTTSGFTNDGDGISPFATEDVVKNHVSEIQGEISDVRNDLTDLSDSLSTVAKTGSYNDLKDQPDIPSIEGLASVNYVDNVVSDKATKDFVNSSISTNTATFRGTVDSVDTLNEITDADENDYAFVISKDDAGNTLYSRFKNSSGVWTFEYNLNNSSFTAEQWATINSGVTASQIQTITTNISNKADKSSLQQTNQEVENLKTKDIELSDSVKDNSSLIEELGKNLELKANLTDLDNYVSMEDLLNYLPTVTRLI